MQATHVGEAIRALRAIGERARTRGCDVARRRRCRRATWRARRPRSSATSTAGRRCRRSCRRARSSAASARRPTLDAERRDPRPPRARSPATAPTGSARSARPTTRARCSSRSAGAVARPGVYEIALGTPLDECSSRRPAARPSRSALLVGGYFGAWLPAERARDAARSTARAAPRRRGARRGRRRRPARPRRAGSPRPRRVVALARGRDRAGQCGPCVHGLGAIAGALDRARARRPREPAPHRRLAALGRAWSRPRRLPPSRRRRPLRRERARRFADGVRRATSRHGRARAHGGRRGSAAPGLRWRPR